MASSLKTYHEQLVEKDNSANMRIKYVCPYTIGFKDNYH